MRVRAVFVMVAVSLVVQASPGAQQSQPASGPPAGVRSIRSSSPLRVYGSGMPGDEPRVTLPRTSRLGDRSSTSSLSDGTPGAGSKVMMTEPRKRFPPTEGAV